MLGSGTVIMALGFLALIILLIAGAKSGRFISLYFIISLLLYLALYMFTSMDYAQRYTIPFIFLLFPMIFMVAALLDGKAMRYVADLLIVFMIVLMVRNVSVSSLTPDYRNANSEFFQIRDYLLSEGISEGYSTYWQSTVSAMVSDGQIETWSINLPESPDRPVFSADNLNMFLQCTDHETRLPSGRRFLLLTNDEAEQLAARLPADHLRFSTDSYKVYIFEPGEEL